jgi:transposase-like protein
MTQSTRAATTRLSADERKAIAIQGLAKAVSISTLAVHHNVSRPLVYRQLRQASAALDDVFSPAETDDTGEVLFMLPVTQRWLDQVILALTMVGHVSFRATIGLLRDLVRFKNGCSGVARTSGISPRF